MPDTEDAEVRVIPIPRSVVQRERDADAEEGDTERAGMRIPRESNAEAEATR
jgi:hypothetical protein